MSHELARIEALEKRVTELEKLLKEQNKHWEYWRNWFLNTEASVLNQIQQQQGQVMERKANNDRPYSEVLDVGDVVIEALIQRWVPAETLKKAREIKKKRGKVDGD